jgi:hypothetical protein
MFGGDTRDGKIPAGVGGWQKWGVGVKIIDGVVKLGGILKHRVTEAQRGGEGTLGLGIRRKLISPCSLCLRVSKDRACCGFFFETQRHRGTERGRRGIRIRD